MDYSRKLSNFAKIEIKNAKYSGYNNSFTSNLTIVYDICPRAGTLPRAKINAFLIIFKNPALNNYHLNIGISNNTIINSHHMCYSIYKM